jgi:multidrug resistance efflux pump
MRKFLIPAIMAGAMVAAAPASAQSWRFQGAAFSQMRAEIQQLHNQISRAQQNRRISPREAQGLRRQAATLQRNFSLFSRNGIDRREHAVLDGQLRQIRQNLRAERRDFDRRRG